MSAPSQPASPGYLQIEAISLTYPGRPPQQPAVNALSLRMARGEIGCLLGASGCGKTSVLRAVAGFEPLLGGRILLNGETLSTASALRPPEQRRIGVMFQDYALFPHLTAAENVGFGLRRRPRAERQARIIEMLSMVGLADCVERYPHQLSGGQQQRVALARALAPAPDLLLLDEPFSNLDSESRSRLVDDTRALLKAADITALMVTHDPAEAFALADTVGVMADGELLQWDRPEALYSDPVDRRVAEGIGRGHWLQASTLGLNESALLRVHASQLELDSDGPIEALLETVRFVGPHQLGRLRFDSGERAEISLAVGTEACAGSRIRLRLGDGPLMRLRSREDIRSREKG